VTQSGDLSHPHAAPSADSALDPVRAEILRRAQEDAEHILEAARADARGEHDRAAAEGAALTARAIAAGRGRAAARLAAARRTATQVSRANLLAAQRRAYEQWRAAGTAAVLELRSEPDYPRLRDELRATAIRLLGPQAIIAEDPAGGLIARGGGRILDLTLNAVAAHALDLAEPGIGALWE